MDLEQAKELIAFKNTISIPQLWIDLGAGRGLFTRALASYLPPGSKIIAVDKNENALRQLPAEVNSINIETITADFIVDTLDVKAVDGILMANSLHYVKDKETFLRKLTHLRKTNAFFLLVEYDRTRANQWVLYPITIDAAKELFKSAGYLNFQLLNTTPSAYGDEMYAALISH
jgi:ubiquinone/menaquinone biosynthesis C-methylase UbiE